MILCAALVVVPVVMKSRKVQEAPDQAAFLVQAGSLVPVKVSGAVKHPGIYMVPVNSMTVVAINMAVSLRPLDFTISEPIPFSSVQNGSAITLYERPDGSRQVIVGQMTVPERMVLGIPLDITIMSEADFDRLPGIGPAMSRRIVEYRQNNGGILRVEDLAAVQGIGEKKYQKLRAYF